MASYRTRNLFTERTNLHTWLLAISLALFGVGLLVLAQFGNLWVNIESLQEVVREIGSFLLVTVAVTAVWDLREKRVFRDEIFSEIRLSEDIRSGGIIGFTPSTHHHIDWDSLFRDVQEIDILFAYGRTWRRIHGQQLEEAAKRKARIRVILPDPYNAAVVAVIKQRSRLADEEEARKLILEAAEEFRELHKLGAMVNIWFLHRAPEFSLQRFDHKMVITPYSHRTEKKPAQLDVPAFITEDGGSYYKFARDDFEAITRDGDLAKLGF